MSSLIKFEQKKMFFQIISSFPIKRKVKVSVGLNNM